MQYKSTRGSQVVTDTYALLHGLAEDGGLYVPSEFPVQSLRYEDIAERSYEEIALVVLRQFFPSFTEDDLTALIGQAYNTENFAHERIVPLASLEDDVSIMELFHGRTQAFKDLALSLFPYLLVKAKELEGEDREVLILTATSGDTGKAALEGFKNVAGTHIQVFYPTDGVSPMQQEQMQKQDGDNVNVVAIRGNFDDAQQFLKRTFVDAELNRLMHENGVVFSSANSINIGRLIPQVVYYVAAYGQMVDDGIIVENEVFDVVVPTGNFGNILAAYYAKQMGIPVGRLICASNRNHVLTDFFKTGIYDMNREFYATNSPSMDILESSNFERFLYYVTGEDATRTKALMQSLKETGSLRISEDELALVQSEFAAAYLDEDETRVMIERIYNSYGYVLDPHTAVAVGAWRKTSGKTGAESVQHTLIAGTAHPFKFPNAICESLGIELGATPYESLENIGAVTGVGLPQELAVLADKPVRFATVIDKDEMKDSIIKFVQTF